MTAVLDGPGFVGADVPGFGGDHALVGAQQRVDDGGVCLRAADEEEDLSLRGFTGFADFFPRGLGVFVKAVARGLFKVCFQEPL